MADFFTVTDVIDGDTFVVSPNWTWKGNEGDHVRPTGYNTPEKGEPDYETATDRLTGLILKEKVQLVNCVHVDRGRLVCQVLIGGGDVASYFSEYQ